MRPLPHAQAVLDDGLAARTYSAVAAEMGTTAGAAWSYARGQLGFDDATPVDADTVFDLASLTKVLSTTAISLLLQREQRLDLNVPVVELVPEWSAPDRSGVTVQDLLEHSSGLPAHRDYFHHSTGREAFIDAIAREPLEYAPRSKAIYSDLGFILLGAALERVGGAAIDRQFDSWKSSAGIDAPLTYSPPATWKRRSAITRFSEHRGRTLQGEVDDENAAALGGVAPHAGLFGTAAAVGLAARWWLMQFATEDGRRFTRRSEVANSSRALGWDTMLKTSSCGTCMSPAAVGHTGFTGTSLWIDPPSDRYFVLLTNRVHAPGSSEAIQQVRRAFHDAAHLDVL